MSHTASTSALCARELCKHYGKDEGLVRAVDRVDVDVAGGETVAVMGPSDCGKSTLLQLLGGLDRPTSGEVQLAGRRMDRMSEKALAGLRCDAVGFVFQAFHLMDELTAVENVELPALLAGISPRAARRRAAELLEQTGLADRSGQAVTLRGMALTGRRAGIEVSDRGRIPRASLSSTMPPPTILTRWCTGSPTNAAQIASGPTAPCERKRSQSRPGYRPVLCHDRGKNPHHLRYCPSWRTFPSGSLNHAPRAPLSCSAIPSIVFTPGRSYSSNTIPRSRSCLTADSTSSTSNLIHVPFAVPANSDR
jgi:ABC-type uncharacterized transport system YnjBCD ATPase subunit